MEALYIRRELVKTNPSAYSHDLADILNDLAILYEKLNRLKEAEKAFIEALNIKIELAKNNPSAYNSSIADTLNNLALYMKN